MSLVLPTRNHDRVYNPLVVSFMMHQHQSGTHPPVTLGAYPSSALVDVRQQGLKGWPWSWTEYVVAASRANLSCYTLLII